MVRRAFARLCAGVASIAVCLCLSHSTFAEPPRPVAIEVPLSRSGLQGYDLEGVFHRPGEKESTRAIVFVFLATECPISNRCLPVLNQLAANPRKSGVEVYGVLSSAGISRSRGRRHHKEYALTFPVLFDSSGALRDRLKATHSPHAFVLSRDGAVLYQGAIDDQHAALGKKRTEASKHYLTDAVTAVTTSKEVPLAATPPVGCLLEKTADKATARGVTFHRDVAPILHRNCTRCHRDGQTAPFALVTADDAKAHARQIVEMTRRRLMPPWRAVHGFGEFKDERRLSERDIATLAAWVDGGSPAGDEADALQEPRFNDEWQLGKPDVVLKMPKPFSIPAAGSDVHQHFVLPTNAHDAHLISAVEFKPGNPRVVHHACFYLDNTATARKLDLADPALGYGGQGGAGFEAFGTLRSWLPGQTPRRLPQGSGRAMPRGADLVLEIHYHPSGKVETDQSSLGLYYAPRKARQIVSEIQVLNHALEIPAGVARHRHASSYTLPTDVTLLDCAPHMHLLGREMKAVATCPDGRVVPLIWVQDWNYLWQEQYEYREPIRLPKGARIDVESWFDNSAANPLNPHSPPKAVEWGEQTTDEMSICHFQVTCDRMDDFIAFNRSYSELCASRMRDFRTVREARARSGTPPVISTAPVAAPTIAAP